MSQSGAPASDDLAGARLLLRRLRATMAQGGSAEQRLAQIVKLIAVGMVAEVCSVYLMRAGEVLELFATEGLRAEAVHRTRLRVGEGLVGDIASHARPLALAEAQSHPQFAYRPETGEEIYHSLLGVPILHSGLVSGVLVVQNRKQRHYSEEEVETLETVAMVVAELVARGEFVSREERASGLGIAVLPERMEGETLAPGLAIGIAAAHQPDIELTQLVAEEPGPEIERLDAALAKMKLALDDLLAETSGQLAVGEQREVMETYRMLAEDRGWASRIVEAIGTGLTAPAAVKKVQNDLRARWRDMQDAYLRERLADLDDLANRLLRHLLDLPEGRGGDLPENTILIARHMGPAELLDYDRRRLKGVVLEEGSANAHVAIIARALDIPLLGRCAEAMAKVQPGDPVIVDGEGGQLFLRPSEDIQAVFVKAMKDRQALRASYAAARDLPVVTQDGVAIALFLNAGLLIDLAQVAATGAAGIGLYRTEITFMTAADFPDVGRQADVYRRVLDGAGGKPVVFRTLDIGSDKALPYWHRAAEENPAMGWRALRIALDRPALLRRQLRALIRAASGRELRLMFPMVTEIDEFDRARAILDLEWRRARDRAETLPTHLSLGAMFEVPALYWQLPELLDRVDFLSVGSNDLKQFVFAADRGNSLLTQRYDELSPAFLRLLAGLLEAARDREKPVGLCGEMAGDPIAAMALIALGFRTLSVAPPAIGPLRAMIRSLDLGKLKTYMAALGPISGGELRVALRAFARDHTIAV